MLDRLPELIDPLLFADRECRLKGEIQLSSLPRLAAILAEDSGSVVIELSFGRHGRSPWVRGRIEAILRLKCQNCLEVLDWPVNSEFKLGIVTSIDEANLLSDDYEPLLVGEEKIALNEIIEEELLLSVPAFPKHDTECFVNTQAEGNKFSEKNAPSDPNNPFSVLAKLKSTGD